MKTVIDRGSQVVKLRSSKLSWEQIGKIVGISPREAEHLYDTTVDKWRRGA